VIAIKLHVALLALVLVSVPGGSQAAIEITDDAENRIVLQQPANRIVSLAPHVTELLFAAGSGDAVVATVDYSDFPTAALDIPRVGNSQTISYETVVGLEPDLVIAWQSGNGSSVIARLKGLGLTTYTNEPRQLVDIPRSLRHFGVITGRRSSGERAARAFERRYGTLRDKYSKQKPVTVFYQVWDSPLTTLNGEHLVSDAIRLCGGRNIFTDAIPLAPRVSLEAVIEANPHVIIASGMGEARPDWLDRWARWPQVRAVQDRRLFFIPPELLQRHTPRLLDGARQLCDFLQQAR
tara:strand:+ start:373 stop:1254 length:882 start_codon:yes stop_codon:yes gene_type:complete